MRAGRREPRACAEHIWVDSIQHLTKEKKEGNDSSLMALNRLTTEEVAKVYCCNEHRVTWLRKQGLLPGVKFGKHYLYLEDDVDRLMRASTRHTVAELASMSPDALRNALEAHDD